MNKIELNFTEKFRHVQSYQSMSSALQPFRIDANYGEFPKDFTEVATFLFSLKHNSNHLLLHYTYGNHFLGSGSADPVSHILSY